MLQQCFLPPAPDDTPQPGGRRCSSFPPLGVFRSTSSPEPQVSCCLLVSYYQWEQVRKSPVS